GGGVEAAGAGGGAGAGVADGDGVGGAGAGRHGGAPVGVGDVQVGGQGDGVDVGGGVVVEVVVGLPGGRGHRGGVDQGAGGGGADDTAERQAHANVHRRLLLRKQNAPAAAWAARAQGAAAARAHPSTR